MAEQKLEEARSQLQAASEELGAALGRASAARDTLDAAEGLVDELLALVPTALIILDADLRVVGWSSGAEDRWSRPAGQAVGRKWSRIKRTVDEEIATSQLDELLLEDGPEHPVSLGALTVRRLKVGTQVRYLLLAPTESLPT